MVDNAGELGRGSYRVGSYCGRAARIERNRSGEVWLDNFVRFAACGFGFHRIPTSMSNGAQIHPDWMLGTNLRESHGCIRLSNGDVGEGLGLHRGRRDQGPRGLTDSGAPRVGRVPSDLTFPEPLVAFWRERHLCTVTSLRARRHPARRTHGHRPRPRGRARLGDHLRHLAEGAERAAYRQRRGLPGRRPLVVDARGPRRGARGRGLGRRGGAPLHRALPPAPREPRCGSPLRIQLTRLLGNVGEDTTR